MPVVPTSLRSVSRILLILGIGFCLLMIWLPDYFVTGDGPCHLYNASILKAWLGGEHAAFFRQEFLLHTQWTDNWLVHGLLLLLLLVFPAAIAEKCFLTIYLLLFIGGMYQCLKKQNCAPLLVLPAFLLVFHLPLMKGFYSFSLAFALLPWMWYLFSSASLHWKSLFAKWIIALLLFLAHPFVFVFGAALVCIRDLIRVGLKQLDRRTAQLGFFMHTLILLPLWGWLWSFNAQQVHHPFRFFFNRAFITQYFLRFHSFAGYHPYEYYPALLAAFLFLSGFFITGITRIRAGVRLQEEDTFLFMLVLCGVVYIFFPDYFLIGLLELRMQCLIYLFMFMYTAQQLETPVFMKLYSFGAWILFLILCGIRLPSFYSHGRQISSMMRLAHRIPDERYVLALCFNHHGADEERGNESLPVFIHAHQYMGTQRALFFPDNYEAHTTYFPLQFKPGRDPYRYLCKDEQIESETPEADLQAYTRQTHQRFEFVLLNDYNPLNTYPDATAKLLTEIKQQYQLVATSTDSIVQLYQLASASK